MERIAAALFKSGLYDKVQLLEYLIIKSSGSVRNIALPVALVKISVFKQRQTLRELLGGRIRVPPYMTAWKS